MNDFEKVDLINELTEIIQTKDKKLNKKSQIMKKLTMEILDIYKTKSSVKKDNDSILMEILLFTHIDENNKYGSMLEHFHYWLDKDKFLNKMISLVDKNASVLKSIFTIYHENKYIHGFNTD